MLGRIWGLGCTTGFVRTLWLIFGIGYIFQEETSDGIPARSADEEASGGRRAGNPSRSRPTRNRLDTNRGTQVNNLQRSSGNKI